VTKIIH